MRRWLFWLLIFAFVWLLISHLTEIEKLVQTLQKGRWQWMLIAALFQIFSYVFYACLLWSSYQNVGLQSRVLELLPVTFAAVFANTVAPTGGTAGLALFVHNAVRRGQSAARATAGNLLATVAEFSTFTLILTVGMVHLFLRHNLKVYEIIAALGLILFTGIQSSALLLGMWRPSLLRRLLNIVYRFVNKVASRFRRSGLLAKDWTEKIATEFTAAASAIGSHRVQLAQTSGFALAMHLANLSCLYAIFLAFHNPVKLGILVSGYAMGFLFLNVSPIPQGIGLVEGVMTLVFTSLGVSSEIALVVTLAYRGMTFWLPLLAGFFLLRRATWVDKKDLKSL